MNSFMNLPEQRLAAVSAAFQSQQPYRYVDLSGVFVPQVLARCAQEIDASIAQIPAEQNFYGSHKKYKLSRRDAMPPHCREFVTFLNSPEFIARLEQITGISGLHPDPDLQGGGIHAISRGGYLKVHTDFNWNAKLAMHRRLNLLIYLNDPWQDEWGGAIELWSPDMRSKVSEMAPKLGNALLFATTDSSYHGHPDPLQCPDGTYRRSIAMYYYSQTRPEEEVAFGRSEMTNYAERPKERFGGDRFRRLCDKAHLRIKKWLNA
jgi:hypothetical protein